MAFYLANLGKLKFYNLKEKKNYAIRIFFGIFQFKTLKPLFIQALCCIVVIKLSSPVISRAYFIFDDPKNLFFICFETSLNISISLLYFHHHLNNFLPIKIKSLQKQVLQTQKSFISSSVLR